MLQAEPAEFLFCFYTSLVTFWGMLVANDTKIVHFTFYVYFPGHPRHALVRKRTRSENERGVKNTVEREGNFDRSAHILLA